MGEWVYSHTSCLCRTGVDFDDFGVYLSLSHVVMSWLRLKPLVECIAHPYDIYTECFSTLICYEWVNGSTLTLVCLCRFGGGFSGKTGDKPEPK